MFNCFEYIVGNGAFRSINWSTSYNVFKDHILQSFLCCKGFKTFWKRYTIKPLLLLEIFISIIQLSLDCSNCDYSKSWFFKLHFYCFQYSYHGCGVYFSKSESPEVRIYSHFGWFGLVKIGPTTLSYRDFTVTHSISYKLYKVFCFKQAEMLFIFKSQESTIHILAHTLIVKP